MLLSLPEVFPLDLIMHPYSIHLHENQSHSWTQRYVTLYFISFVVENIAVVSLIRTEQTGQTK